MVKTEFENIYCCNFFTWRIRNYYDVLEVHDPQMFKKRWFKRYHDIRSIVDAI